VFRGKQSRTKPENNPFSVERVKQYVKPNPNYDPAIIDPDDLRSQKELYYKPKPTSNEAKIIKYNKAVAKQQRERTTQRKERLEREENERQRRIEEMEQNVLFQDQDERSLKQKIISSISEERTLKT
jgi:hypothetical protein